LSNHDSTNRGILPIAVVLREAQDVGIHISDKDIEILLLMFSPKNGNSI
jgi:hypothetical protein